MKEYTKPPEDCHERENINTKALYSEIKTMKTQTDLSAGIAREKKDSLYYTLPAFSHLVVSYHVSGHRQYRNEHHRVTTAHDKCCSIYTITTGNSLHIEPSACTKYNCARNTESPLQEKKTNRMKISLCWV